MVFEAICTRRVCEDKTDYFTSLEDLKNECFKSKIPKTFTSKIIEQAKSWVDRFHPVDNNKIKESKQYGLPSFQNYCDPARWKNVYNLM